MVKVNKVVHLKQFQSFYLSILGLLLHNLRFLTLDVQIKMIWREEIYTVNDPFRRKR